MPIGEGWCASVDPVPALVVVAAHKADVELSPIALFSSKVWNEAFEKAIKPLYSHLETTYFLQRYGSSPLWNCVLGTDATLARNWHSLRAEVASNCCRLRTNEWISHYLEAFVGDIWERPSIVTSIQFQQWVSRAHSAVMTVCSSKDDETQNDN